MRSGSSDDPGALDPASTSFEHDSRAAERSEGEQDPKRLRGDELLHVKIQPVRLNGPGSPPAAGRPPQSGGPWLCVPASRRVCPGRSVHPRRISSLQLILAPGSGGEHPTGVPPGSCRWSELPGRTGQRPADGQWASACRSWTAWSSMWLTTKRSRIASMVISPCRGCKPRFCQSAADSSGRRSA
jgi:hypothetical protein